MSTSARLCSRISRSFWHSRCIPAHSGVRRANAGAAHVRGSMRARSCAQPSRHSNGSARPPGAVQRAHRPLQPHQMIQPAVRHAKSDAEQPRGLGDGSGQWSRPDTSGRRRARVANSRSAIQLRVRPSGTSHPAPAGARLEPVPPHRRPSGPSETVGDDGRAAVYTGSGRKPAVTVASARAQPP
jgi:hypothetical protein